MTTSIPGFSAPAAGTEVPLEMLSACHHRVERQCATLKRLVPHLVANGADREARTAATNILRYFDTSAKDHHADEEVDLFPALIAAAPGPDAVSVRELVAALLADHRALDATWRRVRAVLERVAGGESVLLVADEVDALVAHYDRHIEREERELLPLASRLLGADELARVGRAMRERRGIADSP